MTPDVDPDRRPVGRGVPARGIAEQLLPAAAAGALLDRLGIDVVVLDRDQPAPPGRGRRRLVVVEIDDENPPRRRAGNDPHVAARGVAALRPIPERKRRVGHQHLFEVRPLRQLRSFPGSRLPRHVAGDDLQAAGAIHRRPKRWAAVKIGIEVR